MKIKLDNCILIENHDNSMNIHLVSDQRYLPYYKIKKVQDLIILNLMKVL